MTTQARIYLDNAATSWPKPETVYTAVDAYQRELGAPVGRGAYREATQVERLLDDARRAVAALFDVDDARRIVFTSNGTDSLNQAIHGVVRPGDHVVTNVSEHNSVLRPLRWLEKNQSVRVTRVGCDAHGLVDTQQFCDAIEPATRLVVLQHASNVTGTVQPVAEVGDFLRAHDALFLVDAAQTAGHWPISVEQIAADLVATPGHKALLGPLGTGILYVGPKAESQISAVRQGGTGTQSETDEQPNTLPDKLESGNHNVAGIAGLAAGVRFVADRGVEALQHDGRQLTARLLAQLGDIPALRVIGINDGDRRVPVVSFTIEGYDPQDVAAMLDAGHRVQARAGFHCAPLIHKTIGTAQLGGAVRLSPGPFTTDDEIDTAVDALAEIVASRLPS